jgi:acetyl-CoA carboxylase beta subunit
MPSAAKVSLCVKVNYCVSVTLHCNVETNVSVCVACSIFRDVVCEL